MNEVLNAILTRRSVRSYKPDPVPEDVLSRLSSLGHVRRVRAISPSD